ncbi:hypothetical protein DOY81_001700 [Sarcophaga bullata]|nr:hypothetical protein DOY81_001700 [Sarcophaga bullata]
MTTTTDQSEDNDGEQQSQTESNPTSLPQEIMDIMIYLSLNSKIVFKSQQRNEPELEQKEKVKVALDVYRRNPQTFLIRFGNYLEDKHLQNFARLSIAEGDSEMHLMVKDYQNKLKTRQQDIKNRRYAAMQKLIAEGEYFSEQEMMKRQPELYQELVGQYLSASEKQQRDSYDVRNTTFSGILMHDLERKQLDAIMEKAEKHLENAQQNDTSPDEVIEKDVLKNLEKEDAEVPVNCRQQWGNFDNEPMACSSSKVTAAKSLKKNSNKLKAADNLITADERELLRQEFISQMHEQFLTGQDEDFDYAAVDDNTQFDDLNLINQDKEDKYFEESDSDSDVEGNVNCKPANKMEADDESEDELDVYMSHLNKHHSLIK